LYVIFSEIFRSNIRRGQQIYLSISEGRGTVAKKEGFFIIDSEAHIMPWEFRKHISYYPASAYFSKPAESPTGKWWNTNPLTKERREKPSDWTLEGLIKDMDEAGIDMACMLRESFLNMSYNGVPCSTNFHTIEAMQKYPKRIIGCSQWGPSSHPGGSKRY